MFKIAENLSSIDYEKIYSDNKNTFDEVDYLYDRYSIEYTIVLIEFKDDLLHLDLHLKELLRLSDKYIKLNEKYHLILFTYTSFKQACQAILSLERKITKKYSLYYKNVLFNSYSQEKTREFSSLELLKKINTLLVQKKI